MKKILPVLIAVIVVVAGAAFVLLNKGGADVVFDEEYLQGEWEYTLTMSQDGAEIKANGKLRVNDKKYVDNASMQASFGKEVMFRIKMRDEGVVKVETNLLTQISESYKLLHFDSPSHMYTRDEFMKGLEEEDETPYKISGCKPSEFTAKFSESGMKFVMHFIRVK